MAEPIRNGGGSVAVEELTKVGPRRAGSEAERRAARYLQQRLGEMGRAAHLEPTRIRPAIALTHLIHAVAGVVGSVLAVYSHGVGLLIAALATLSALGDLTAAYPGIRLLTPVRASQNVICGDDSGKPGLVVLVAHYDAPRDATLFTPRARRWPTALLGSLTLVTICAIVRVLGIEGTLLTVLQFIPTVVLILLTPLLADAALAETTIGNPDNVTGVATALSLAREQLAHFDVMLVFTGGSAHHGLGMRGWLKRHRRELDTEATAVICLDNAQIDEPLYAEREGPVFTNRMHPSLCDLAAEGGAQPYRSREFSDAYLSRSSGLPTIRINGCDTAFVRALLGRIDSEIGARLG